MLHRKANRQFISHNWVVSQSGISPISHRVTHVETYDSFQKKVRVASIVVVTTLLTSPIWAFFMVKFLTNSQHITAVINGMKALVQ